MADLKMTTPKAVRASFWANYPNASRRKIPHYSGTGTMYCTDTRVLFVEYVDMLCRDGDITPELAQRVTLGGD